MQQQGIDYSDGVYGRGKADTCRCPRCFLTTPRGMCTCIRCGVEMIIGCSNIEIDPMPYGDLFKWERLGTQRKKSAWMHAIRRARLNTLWKIGGRARIQAMCHDPTSSLMIEKLVACTTKTAKDWAKWYSLSSYDRAGRMKRGYGPWGSEEGSLDPYEETDQNEFPVFKTFWIEQTGTEGLEERRAMGRQFMIELVYWAKLHLDVQFVDWVHPKFRDSTASAESVVVDRRDRRYEWVRKAIHGVTGMPSFTFLWKSGEYVDGVARIPPGILASEVKNLRYDVISLLSIRQPSIKIEEELMKKVQRYMRHADSEADSCENEPVKYRPSWWNSWGREGEGKNAW